MTAPRTTTTAALIFTGAVTDGKGKYARELTIPGRRDLPNAPSDWPDELCPGSFNVRIAPDGYPGEFARMGLPDDVRVLDRAFFRPAFEIPAHAIAGNLILPTADDPRRGTAQVWRADLRPALGLIGFGSWVVRRLGSKRRDQLELVAGIRLRDMGFSNGRPVLVTLLGQWRE